MIGQLAGISETAQPTAFHGLLKALDDRGKLLRVYTQNIDALEAKTGLSYGVPDFDDRRQRSRPKPSTSSGLTTPPTSQPARLPSPPAETPRCVPLHGTLQTLHCQNCSHSFPAQPHVSQLSAGSLPDCPECTALEETRALVGKRSRGIGRLRPSVVLYNEPHKDGEGVGAAVERDLLGRGGRGGPDLLLVVGTSLRVPGTKRIVREFAKAARARDGPPVEVSSGLPTPTSSPRLSPAAEDVPIRSVYLNLGFPVPTREWEGVFDAWVNDDAQDFAAILDKEIKRDDEQKRLRAEQKRRRELAAEAAQTAEAAPPKPPNKGGEKRKNTVDAYMKAAKRCRVDLPKSKSVATKKDTKTCSSADATPTSSSKTNAPLTIRIPPQPPTTAKRMALSGPTSGLVPEVVLPFRPKVVAPPVRPPTPVPSPPLSSLSSPPANAFPTEVTVSLQTLSVSATRPYGLRSRR